MAASNFGGLRIVARRKTVATIPIAVNKAFHVLMPTPSISQHVLIIPDISKTMGIRGLPGFCWALGLKPMFLFIQQT